MGLPPYLEFRGKGQLALDICANPFVDGLRLDFICGSEAYRNCTGFQSSSKASPEACAAARSDFRLALAVITPHRTSSVGMHGITRQETKRSHQR